MKNKGRMGLKSLFLWILIMAMVCSAASGAVYLPEAEAIEPEEISCRVKFSQPAICCDAGQTVELDRCGVQFSPSAGMTLKGITWTYEGSTVTEFTPAERGVYALQASSENDTMTVYVVAKDSWETEYVLYRNNFDTLPSDYRTVGGKATVEDGSYVIDSEEQAQVLLPEFLDAFGDATVQASMKLEGALDDSYGALLYRVQQEGGQYQARVLQDASQSGGVALTEEKGDQEQSCGSMAWGNAYEDDYNLYQLTGKGTYTTFSLNGVQLLDYANTEFAAGGWGFQVKNGRLLVDYIQVSLEGNDPLLASCDVSFAKPAIRSDMGDTIDLTACDVQFAADTLYTPGDQITWTWEGSEITTFTPAAAGVTPITASWDGITKTVYVVTRNLTEGDYVLYRNDFNAAPQDFRAVQRTGSKAYYDGAGHYVLDASGSASAYTKVLLPEFLDDFQDFSLEASCWASKPASGDNWSALGVYQDAEDADGLLQVKSEPAQAKPQARTGSSVTAPEYDTYTLEVQSNTVTGQINGETVVSLEEHGQIVGGMSLQAQAQRLSVDYVQVTLGATTAAADTSVSCYVGKARPAIGCNVGQTINLSQCAVQFSYGAYAVPGNQITWKKDGKVITQYSNTTEGVHTLSATHGHTTMNVYVVAKKSTSSEHILYSTDFSTSPTDYRVPEKKGGGTVYPLSGTFVLNGSASKDAYVRVLLPVFLDQFGDLDFEASVKQTDPVDNTKWASIMYRVQNSNFPYMQCCWRYNSNAENGVEISERNKSDTWTVLHKGSTTKHASGGYNVINITTSGPTTTFYINGTQVLQGTDTPYYNGCWGFQVRGVTMTIDYVRMFFKTNYTASTLYTVPGGIVDVRDPATGISVAPAMVTEVKTSTEFENILTNSPAVAIMTYDVVGGVPRIVFSDGYATPDAALDKLGSKVIPAFRVNDSTDVNSLVSFLKGRNQRDVYAVSSDLSLLKQAYTSWSYIRGVADYSSYTSYDPETLRYNALANGARVMILPESAARDDITFIQDRYASVWLTISGGKTATVAATNKGPYGLITPDRATTEYCYNNYYGANTLVRSPNVIGHRGVVSQAPENTILGTQTAYSNGADIVENDIYLAADGVVMVMHDQTIDRTTNGSGQIVNMTSTQLKQYKVDYYSGVAAQPIPTLEDYFKLIKGNANQKLVIEMKHPYDARLANAMVAMIKKYDILDQVVIMSFIQQNVSNTTAALPGAPVGWLNRLELHEGNYLKITGDILENVQPYNAVFNPEYLGWGSDVIKDQAYRGITLWPWTVNKHDQFDQLIINGIAGVTTDYCQWSKNYIESIHWNSASRVISSTYQDVLTDITNTCEVVVIEDTLGITCSAGNIIVPDKPEGGMASFYYRYKCTTASGGSYYMVTEIRTINVQSIYTLSLKSGSSLKLASNMLTKVSDTYTVSTLSAQFQYPVEVLDANGNVLSNSSRIATGYVVRLKADTSKKATIIVYGDVNGDGRLNGTDYLLLKSHFLKDTQLTGVYLTAADCNLDGSIDSTDYLRIKSHFLGEINIFT